jgi:hypothetical protein
LRKWALGLLKRHPDEDSIAVKRCSTGHTIRELSVEGKDYKPLEVTPKQGRKT